jgi:cellulose synthase operon protein YhjU
VALNHDGKEGHFLDEMTEIGAVAEKPMAVSDLTPPMYSFDDSPIYSDYDVLAKWWDDRLRSSAERTVLYYNTITMHDGARKTKAYTGDSLADYKPRLVSLFADLDRFFAKVEASGRSAVVVFLPEHGANLRGDKKQIAGMREIPSPTISIVPVGIKLIGAGRLTAAPVIVDAPSSYLAVTSLVSRFIERDPFNSGQLSLTEYIHDLPQTAFVAENSRDILIMSHEGRYYMLANRETWSPYQP